MAGYQNIYQAAREGASLTQEAAAERLGWSVRNLQAIEQEERVPTAVRVAEMASSTVHHGCAAITAIAVRSVHSGRGRRATSSFSSLRSR